MRRRLRTTAVAAVLIFFIARIFNVAADEAPRVAVAMSANEIYLGESVDYQVTMENIKTPSAPDMSAFNADFKVVMRGEHSANQNFTLIVNGQDMSRRSFGHVYLYQLTPLHSGLLTLPAPTTVVDGEKLAGQIGSLRVIAPEKQDVANIEIVPSRTKVYPMQPFDITLRVWVKPLPDVPNRNPLSPLRNPPGLQINWDRIPDGLTSDDTNKWLQKYLTGHQEGFTLNGMVRQDAFSFMEGRRYWTFDLYVGNETHKTLDGRDAEYAVFELKRTFTPVKTGTYDFGGSLKGAFVDGASGGRYSARQVFAVAQPQTVEVRDIPEPRPSMFCGGIGSYTVTLSATPTTLRVGDPLTLNLDVARKQGSSALDLVSAPDISTNPKIAEDFEITEKKPIGELKGDMKHFAYGLRPKKPGVNIPPLPIAVFNPDIEKFVELPTTGVQLTVTQGSQVNAVELVGNLPLNQNSGLKSRQSGIFQNITDPTELHNQHVHPILYVIGAGGAWMGYACLALVVANWRRRAGDSVWQRRQRARGNANENVRQARIALERGERHDALRFARASLVGLIADMLDLSAAGMTAHEASAALSAAGINPEIRNKVISLLESIEASEYGSNAAEPATVLASVGELVSQLHRELERRK